MLRKSYQLSALVLSASLFSTSVLGWEFSRQLEVPEKGQLEVDTDVGSIDLTTHDKKTAEIQVSVDGIDKDEFQVDFTVTGNQISFTGDLVENNWGSKNVQIFITVPKTYKAKLETAGGSIRVEGLDGELEADTSGGSLKFEEINGDIRARTSGGSIKVEDVTGDTELFTSGGSVKVKNVDGQVELKTSGGSIKARQISKGLIAKTSGGSVKINNVQGRIKASTSGGSVKASFDSQPSQDINLSTSGGGIQVYLPKGVGLELNAKARKIYSDFPVDGVTSEKRRLRGNINNGGPEMTLKTSNGNININRL